jgi:hypothetical protein
MFFRGSRYQRVAEAEFTGDDKRVVRYKKIRFIGPAAPEAAYVVAQDERLDIVAYRAWREPERYWRICDANRAFWPDALVAEPGRVLLLPAAED